LVAEHTERQFDLESLQTLEQDSLEKTAIMTGADSVLLGARQSARPSAKEAFRQVAARVASVWLAGVSELYI